MRIKRMFATCSNNYEQYFQQDDAHISLRKIA